VDSSTNRDQSAANTDTRQNNAGDNQEQQRDSGRMGSTPKPAPAESVATAESGGNKALQPVAVSTQPPPQDKPAAPATVKPETVPDSGKQQAEKAASNQA
jgi:hypothetical protein